MQKITIGAAVYGPFVQVWTQADRYLCTTPQGSVELQFSVVGGMGIVEPWTAADEPPPPPPPVPQAITMRQARLVLLGAGKLTAVDVAIAAIVDEPTRKAAQIEWEFSNELQRNNNFVRMLAPGLNLTEAQVDALFVAGAKL